MMRFRPERPVTLNEATLSCKTKAEAVYKIEQLRSAGWLAVYAVDPKPLHLCFNDLSDLNEFKKCATSLGIKLKTPVLSASRIDDILNTPEAKIVPDELTSSEEDITGELTSAGLIKI